MHALVAVTVMRVLLFVLHVCLLRVCLRRWGVGRGRGPGSGGVGLCYICVSCESGFTVYMAGPGICV